VAFTFKCPNCFESLDAKEEDVGNPATCPNCHKEITVPKIEEKGDEETATW